MSYIKRAKRSRIWAIPSDEFAEVVNSSKTLKEILNRCGLQSIGGNYKTIQRRVCEDSLSLDHIKLGTNSNKGRKFSKSKVDLSLVMVKNSAYSRRQLKKRLLHNGLLENKCAVCRILPEWNGKILVLRLDHINGVNDDNRLENIRLVCPNCDSQLSTFCGRNLPTAKWYCRDCGKKCSSGCARCQKCANVISNTNRTKVAWPTPDVIRDRVFASSYVAVGRELGVSDVAVRKFLKRSFIAE